MMCMLQFTGMIKSKLFFATLLILVFIVLLSGCSSFFGITTTTTEEATAMPTVIALPTQLSVQARVESQTCDIAQLVAIQTDDKQGDLMAWSPDVEQLAFVQPVNQYSGWYIGDLVIYDPQKQEVVFTSKDNAVFGDLNWAPNGDALAYAELDQDTGTYTVKIVTPDDGSEMDLFGDAAQTDTYASKKGILSWKSMSDLSITSICGSDCVRLFQYNYVSQTLNEGEEIRYNENTSLDLKNELESPDGNWQVSLDEKDNSWLTSVGENHISLLLANTEVMEVKFSKESRYLALRTSEQVLIYELGCSSGE